MSKEIFNLFVFPKKFEFYYFLEALNPKEIYADKIDNLFHIPYQSGFISCCFLNNSDYMFVKTLNPILIKYPTIKPILIGSCGSIKETSLNKFFLVNKAFLGDRGHLDFENTFKFREENLVHSEPKLNQIDTILLKNVERAEIYSTHFLNESNYVGTKEGKIDKTRELFFDMETYYFYDVCTGLALNSFICLRFVTDHVFDSPILSVQKTTFFKPRFLEILYTFLKENEKEFKDYCKIPETNVFKTQEESRKELYKLLRKYNRNNLKNKFTVIINLLPHYKNSNNLKTADEVLQILINDRQDLLKDLKEALFKTILSYCGNIKLEKLKQEVEESKNYKQELKKKKENTKKENKKKKEKEEEEDEGEEMDQ